MQRRKSKIVTLIIVSALVFVSFISFKFTDNLKFITLYSNVNALARGEDMGFGPMCSKSGKSGDYAMILCNNCPNGTIGHYDMDIVAYCNN